jgi:hypothetical protein
MPTLSRYFIKIGLVYLVIGLLMGAIMRLQPVMNWAAQIQLLRPVYFHLIFIGWVTQLIMGVGYWMFPKYSRENPRGNERLGWATLILLNIGLIMRSISEPGIFMAGSNELVRTGFAWMLALASMFLLFAGWLFIFNTWERIKER